MRLFLAVVLLEEMALDPSSDGRDILPMALLVPTARWPWRHRAIVFAASLSSLSGRGTN